MNFLPGAFAGPIPNSRHCQDAEKPSTASRGEIADVRDRYSDRVFGDCRDWPTRACLLVRAVAAALVVGTG
ncbi:hypothetical protein [Massilia litorea]|uniref:Uncharacterized protein n=1 Tax=Massilia litorea TaxID=2769491 RepID=A0A7L9U1I3_9BURK|nr:hypothetical protein [Massilia litorea]QOL48808.1 hypothetical protein LPB04_17890 [Massilia litorea]